MAKTVTIAGLGLIGGSIGAALRRQTWFVRYVDPNVDLEHARASGAADERVEDVEGDIVIIATPVDVAMKLKPKARLITTTCSVMGPFADYIAGHPFAGSEQNGLGAARGDLFDGRPWFVDRDEEEVRTIIEATGARQVVVDPAEHDAAMALTSHLPQVLSTALASLIEQKHIDPIFLGTGLRTFLRLASSSYDVWGSVLDANGRNIGEAERELMRVINSMTRTQFERARRFMATFDEPPAR
jgi:prephenate dehydrogenase